ncbi:hypothetical protein [Demequina oxidasica]|uniref:hypothetical protein n=1 Tax=Demequina oxidasica TaxID=676199 RepID=UPI0007819EA1|nr:hypothetical protein [Demequina oxidasica]
MTVPESTVALESAIASAPTDEIGRVRAMQAFLRATVVLPSGTDVSSFDSVTPVMFPPGGEQCIAVFTSADAAAPVASRAPYMLTISGTSLILRVAKETSIAVSSTAGVVVFSSELLQAVRDDLATRADGDA